MIKYLTLLGNELYSQDILNLLAYKGYFSVFKFISLNDNSYKNKLEMINLASIGGNRGNRGNRGNLNIIKYLISNMTNFEIRED